MHFDGVPSFDIFKKHINTVFRPKTNIIFGIHDPVGLHYLFQLRVSLSPLRSHKFRYNFTDTPSEICHCNHGIEDTTHFLFSGPDSQSNSNGKCNKPVTTKISGLSRSKVGVPTRGIYPKHVFGHILT